MVWTKIASGYEMRGGKRKIFYSASCGDFIQMTMPPFPGMEDRIAHSSSLSL